ncbi:MAG: succinate dehydrogenase, hydrophobic membrane anchor protein [Ancalomicrobiaceae bacterium]|nr:succinate dehydrogenase, hydrophobic membrane anchor protein [Ancalomicrobiaceae bacterium]
MRTPLAKVRGLGSAKEGTGHFWMQRLTAVALVPLVVYFIAFIVLNTSAPYETAVSHIAKPITATVLIAMVIAGLIHMKLGVQVIIEDYIHGAAMKTVLLLGNTLFSYFVGIGTILAVAKIAIGH